MVLGATLTIPLFAGLFANTPFLQAWWYVAAGAYLTRGLHYDGLADICDALGSGPARFHAVLKDSRLGAFGALGLCFAISGMLCGVYVLCLTRHYTVLLLLPAWSRSLPPALASLSFPHPEASLGRILSLHPQTQAAITGACFFCLLPFGVPERTQPCSACWPAWGACCLPAPWPGSTAAIMATCLACS